MEPLNVGLSGLALKEVGAGKKMGMAPKKNEAKSDIVTEEEGEMGGNMEESGDVKSNTSMGKVNKGFGGSARASNTGAVSFKEGSLVEKGKKEVVKDVEEKERAPSICSCEWDFYHSRNLHAKTSMERQKK